MNDKEIADRAVVLVSGGLDSATLMQYVKQRQGVARVDALTFLYGQKHDREIETAEFQAEKGGCERHEIIDLSCLSAVFKGGSSLIDAGMDVPDLAELSEEDRRQPSTYVPNRNMIFLSIAAAYAESRGIDTVFYGAQLSDEYGYWDCTSDFINAMNRTLLLNRRTPVKVKAPFAGMRKFEVVRLGCELGVDFSETWTCYRGQEKPCGQCPSCVERRVAFEKAGIDDPGASV
ncbi:MAG: 7-cyano-7-deazaguanine synthase QueC [Verrucomicrobiota bacterium]